MILVMIQRNFLILAGLLLGACAASQAPMTADELLAQARSEIREIDAAEARERVDDSIVIDVREPEEYEDGHIPGAVNVPRGTLEWRIERIDALESLSYEERREQPILVYCRSGARSALATQTLQRLGFKDVRSIAGGYRDWSETESQPDGDGS